MVYSKIRKERESEEYMNRKSGKAEGRDEYTHHHYHKRVTTEKRMIEKERRILT